MNLLQRALFEKAGLDRGFEHVLTFMHRLCLRPAGFLGSIAKVAAGAAQAARPRAQQFT